MFLPTIHLGLLYNHLGRSEEAIAPLEVAVTASGRHPWTLSALAVCYSALGKLSEVDAISDELLARARRERSEEHTSELQSPCNLVCRLLLEKKKKKKSVTYV